MNYLKKMFINQKRRICKGLAFIMLIMSFLPYIPVRLAGRAQDYSVVYNTAPAYHYDGSLFESGQWFGYYLVGGFLSQGDNNLNINAWRDTHIPGTVPISLTNFSVPDVDVKLKTGAYCLRPKSPNWPNTVHVYEITPELCNEFADISDNKITERDIDALNVAMRTLGLTNDGVRFTYETYAVMRFICWYIGAMGWQSKQQFMTGIHEISVIFDNSTLNVARFKSLCDKTATEIEKSIGAIDTGYTEYMPAFAGRYSNQVPEIDFIQSEDGAYTFTYNFSRPYDKDWVYSCPSGVMVEYASNSVTFKSSVPKPDGLIEGTLKLGSKLNSITPSGGILVCKSDEPEAQDMLIPYNSNEQLTCYARASEGDSNVIPGEFPPLPDVKFYKYDETFKASYNISGEKFDAETNQKLKNAEFEILEMSPSGKPDILNNYWGSGIDAWTGWKHCKRVETNETGYFSHSDTRSYDYIGTYCGGHDEQKQTIEDYEQFIEQCEEENAQAEEDNINNPDADSEPLWDTEAMRGHLAVLQDGYREQTAACEAFSSDAEYHFFHGENGVNSQKSELKEDKQEAYNTFVRLEYDYTVREIRTRSGYILHGKHSDDHPIPVIRTPASESGGSGRVINPDNTTAGLPDAFESVAVTRKSPYPAPGSLTRASLLLPEEEKKIIDQNREASPSSAKGMEPATGSLARRKQSFFTLDTLLKSEEMERLEELQKKDPTEDEELLDKATPSTAKESQLFEFMDRGVTVMKRSAKASGEDSYTVASWEPDWQSGSADSTNTGSNGNNLFSWYIYNHRMEGELHINKRDRELLEKEIVDNASYGDSQADATLEGAVYGLYAAQDMIHPDGKTGKVFAANELISVATTDSNGDASFLAITEVTPTSGTVSNNYNGTSQDPNNPGTYPDYKTENGNEWIGRPLFLGRYYIKEIGRSEGYELSITGNTPDIDTNFGTTGNTEAEPGAAWVDSLTAGAIAGTAGTVISVKTDHAENGVELYFYHYPAATKFGIMRTGSEVRPGQTVAGWNEKETYTDGGGSHVYRNESGSGRAYYRWNYNEGTGLYTRYETDNATPLYQVYQAGEGKKDSDGNLIPVKNSAGEIQYTNVPESKTIPFMNHKPITINPVTIPGTITHVKNTANQLLKEAGYYSMVPAGSKASWYILELTGADEQAQVREILTWYDSQPFYNAAQVESVTETAGKKYALLRYDYMVSGAARAVLYGNELYVKEAIPGGAGLYYFVDYPAGAFTIDGTTGLATILKVEKISEQITMADVINDHIKPQFVPEYETYAVDTQVLDEDGNPVPIRERVPEVSENTNVTATKTMDYLTDVAVYDPVRECFTITIRPERLTGGERNGGFKIETEHPGMASVDAGGQKLHVGEYLKYVLDVTAFASLPSTDWTGTYIKDALLMYDGGREHYEDGGTRETPVSITERVIKQKIKIKKDIKVNAAGEYEDNTNQIHRDWFTENFGGYFDRLAGVKEPSVAELENFRFQVYLKSNLEGLYRDESGAVAWMDRSGKDAVIEELKAGYPAEVQKLFTKVLHTADLFKDSRDAVVANKELYSFTGNRINAGQNPGYTRILETVTEMLADQTGTIKPVERYNYEKFFDAIYVSNTDKWHHTGVPIDTSYKPIPPGNEINTSDIAKENVKASDEVRQFAINWYLDEEVKKLVLENPAGEQEPRGGSKYSDELYDQALYEAIRKTDNYLKPFFSYDLDSIYSIEWDSETDGGKDLDTATLSADTLYAGIGNQDSYYYAASRYLPYGTYVLAEQQPEKSDLNDFPNKHYQIDRPRELILPSVYEDGDITQLNSRYQYDSTKTPDQLLAEYRIRYNEEWTEAYAGKQKEYVIQAHNHDGDFKVFKYGLDLDRIPTNFTVSQQPFAPYKEHYSFQADKTNAYYLPNSKVSMYYRYASVSEQAGMEDSIPFPSGTGFVFKDRIKTMQGVQSAYEGNYAPMLVPWSIAEPAESDIYHPDQFTGYADNLFTNTFYTTKLRIEKLDSETGENVLHDNAVFAIYAAEREDSDTEDGEVKFYDRDTVIRGTKEFLMAMGARSIKPFKKVWGDEAEAGNSWTGTVPAGTPICRESEQIFLTDETGNRTGQFQVFTTMRDGLQADEEDLAAQSVYNQNTGYLETPKPLGAGAYVLCEIKPTNGYARTKPVALEVYSDQVAYYLDGEEGKKVKSTIYREDGMDTARIYLNNTAVRMEVSKIKTTETEAICRTDTRYEGTQLQLHAKYGAENLEFAYNHSGKYLGYGWKKGTLEYLISRKEAGEHVEIVYQDGIFAGYGLITRELESPADLSRYVTGAKLTLYDAIEIKANSTGGDYGYDGVTVTRDGNSNVQSIRIEKGYAGEKTLLAKEKGEDAYTYADEINDTGAGTWTYKTIQREAAEILFYSLSGLAFSEKDMSGNVSGYDKDGNKVQVKDQKSIYALKNGRPVLELTGSRLDQVTYSSIDKGFKNLAPDVKLYHVDETGIRDALVNPMTGMAYVEENGRILVWPVNVAATENGAVIAREKINTYRIATFLADTAQEHVTGTLEGNRFEKKLNPVLNPHGLPVYYQRSEEIYIKGKPVYDIDGDYVRYRYLDLLMDINQAAYGINPLSKLRDIGEEEDTQDDRKLYHRQGESYVIENTWLSGERYPNDPLKEELTPGQADMIKRIMPGCYILEELSPPSGYTKGFPQAVITEEMTQPQRLHLENENIKAEIVKTDATDIYKLTVKSDYKEDTSYTEGKGAYSHSQIAGSRLALYQARKIYTPDSEHDPLGYYFEKVGQTPVTWQVENPADNTMTTVTGEWVTDGTPKYFEGIPAGYYILEELAAASGYVRNRMELEIKQTGEIQSFQLKNDHTKLEVFKYYEESQNKFPLPNSSAAGLTVYEAVTDAQGDIVYQDGLPAYDDTEIIDSWTTDDLKQYTAATAGSTKFFDRLIGLIDGKSKTSGFLIEFEAAYKFHPDMTSITWQTPDGEKRASLTYSKTQDNTESKVQMWRTDAGNDIRITIYRSARNGTPDLAFEYQFNYRELANGVKAYDTLEGMHRIDYIPFNAVKDGKPVGNYVLIEHMTPDGFETADPKALTLTETGDIQRFSLKNEEKYIHVDKVAVGMDPNGNPTEYQVPGVTLGLYKANVDGSFPNEADGESALIESWISGQDGSYTEEDKLGGDILRGYEPGDIKPHRISKIDYGKYYIAELDVPDYMVKNPPQLIEITADKVPVYKVINKLSKGRLTIHKKAEDTGESLAGARFEVKNEQTKESWIIASGTDGIAGLSNMSVGDLKADGTIEPYWYQVREITPPDYYQANPLSTRFQFDGSGNTELLTYSYELKNKPTSVRFTKTNFSDDMLVEGAVVAIYRAKVIDGEYVKDGQAIEIIKTEGQGFTIKKKMIASHAYIAQELKAPEGMLLAKPLVFVLNALGTGISRIDNDFSTITLDGRENVIERMHVSGRVATGVMVQLKDLESGTLVSIQGSDGTCTLTEEDGIKDGGIYEITERTAYSDGNQEVTKKETTRVTLDENHAYQMSLRTFKKTTQALSDSQGIEVDKWDLEGDKQTHTIENPVSLEPNFLSIISEAGSGNRAVKAGALITYQISYKNMLQEAQGVKIRASIGEGLEFLRSTPNGILNGHDITWNLTDVLHGREEVFEIVAVVTGNPGTEISMRAEIGGESCIRENVIAKNNSLTIKNNLSGTGKNGSDRFTYHIRLKDSKDKTLTGYYSYHGTESGRIKGEGEVVLSGNGYITFHSLPDTTRYEITQVETFGYEVKSPICSGIIGSYPASAVFENQKHDETIRDVLIKNGEYVLSETTEYTDGKCQQTGKYRFCINDKIMVDNIDMLDKPIEVIFSKRDITSEEEIEGGRYQLISLETSEVLYEFTKDSEVKLPGELLKPGKEYILREIEAPQGYAYAEDIRFTVSGSGVPERVVMHDAPTQIEIIKVNESGMLLSGSRHQILDHEKKVVIPDFTFEGRPLVITGKLRAGYDYYLRETQAPNGYLLADDILFTVPKVPETITVTMVDPKKPGEGEPADSKMHLKKIDAVSQEGLEGVEFTIYNSEGTHYLTVTTEADGYARFDMPPDGTYVYEETKSPDGYLIPDKGIRFTFIIRDQAVAAQSSVIVKNYKGPDIPVRKISEITGEGLLHAELSIRDQDGNEVFAGITDQNGYIAFRPKYPGIYTVEEKKAPEGYIKTEQKIKFTVHADGTNSGTFSLPNRPEAKKTGYFIVKYSSKLSGTGNISVQGHGDFGFYEKLPNTGNIFDNAEGEWPFMLMLSIVLLIIGLPAICCMYRRRQENDKKKADL